MTIHDNTVPAIDCVDFVRLVDDLVDSDPQAIVAKHLEECPPCLTYLQQMLDLKVLLTHVFDGDRLTDDDIAGVLSAINSLRNDRDR